MHIFKSGGLTNIDRILAEIAAVVSVIAHCCFCSDMGITNFFLFEIIRMQDTKEIVIFILSWSGHTSVELRYKSVCGLTYR